MKITGRGAGEGWEMQSLTVETLRYGSGGQMCRRKRDLGVTNVQVLVKDRGVFKPGERGMMHLLCCHTFYSARKKKKSSLWKAYCGPATFTLTHLACEEGPV